MEQNRIKEPIVTVSWIMNAEEALWLLLGHPWKRLHVIKDGRILGSIGIQDLGGFQNAARRKRHMIGDFVPRLLHTHA